MTKILSIADSPPALVQVDATVVEAVQAMAEHKVGAAVVVDGDEVGTVTSAAGGVGLAYIKRAVESFPVSAESGGATVELRELPLV